jgi:hypothetical protein
MTRRTCLADAARRRVILADAPKQPLDPGGIARTVGAAEILPAPPGGGSPVCWYAVRQAALAARPSIDPPDVQRSEATPLAVRTVQGIASSLRSSQ